MITSTINGRRTTGARPESLTVLITTERCRIVRTVPLDDLAALARWLVASKAEHRGRCGFILPDGCRVVIQRGGMNFGWRYTEAHVLPLFERQKRLAGLPRIHAPHAPKGYSERCTAKAAAHQVFPARYEVQSGASGNVYVVTIHPAKSPAVACTCEHGQWQAKRRQDAHCSHVAAVQRERLGAAHVA